MNNTNKDELKLAMDNAYAIIVENDSLYNIFLKQEQPIYLAFDPDMLENDEYWNLLINNMIEYYCELEEYEKCHELKLL